MIEQTNEDLAVLEPPLFVSFKGDAIAAVVATRDSIGCQRDPSITWTAKSKRCIWVDETWFHRVDREVSAPIPMPRSTGGGQAASRQDRGRENRRDVNGQELSEATAHADQEKDSQGPIAGEMKRFPPLVAH
jgi:hypothetical protein